MTFHFDPIDDQQQRDDLAIHRMLTGMTAKRRNRAATNLLDMQEPLAPLSADVERDDLDNGYDQT